MLDGHGMDIVARPQGTVGVDDELGNKEQGDALDPRRRLGQARQDQVRDVVREILVAPGDEDLAPGQQVAVAVRHGFGLDRR